jgi:hypothetical protein
MALSIAGMRLEALGHLGLELLIEINNEPSLEVLLFNERQHYETEIHNDECRRLASCRSTRRPPRGRESTGGAH